MKFKSNKKMKALNTQGLDTSSVRLTTKEVSKEQLIEDFSVIWYNCLQIKKQLPEKRYIKVLEKIVTNPFTSDEQFPLKNDLERLMFLNLEELRATVTLMVEIMWSDLERKNNDKAIKEV